MVKSLTHLLKLMILEKSGMSGNYKDGKVDGSYTFWYKNGQKSYEENYKDGLRDGKFNGMV